MPFSEKTAEQLLVKCQRHCCLCHQYKGVKVEVHHIEPEGQGGSNDIDNGIPLCFDCHAEVESYNPKHPRGRKYSPSELRKRRDQWFAQVATNGIIMPKTQDRLPEILLILSSPQQNEQSVIGIGDKINDEEIVLQYLDDKDQQFRAVTSPRCRIGRKSRMCYDWASQQYELFDHFIQLTQWPRLTFGISNKGTVYAHNMVVSISLPKDLNVVLFEDVPKPPLHKPYPSERQCIEDNRYDGTPISAYGWKCPKCNELTNARRILRTDDAILSSDGTEITWRILQLEHGGNCRALHCAINPDERSISSIIRYSIHCEELHEPIINTLTIQCSSLDSRDTLDNAWTEMSEYISRSESA